MKNKIDFNVFNNDNLEQLENYLEKNKNELSSVANKSLQNIINYIDDYKDKQTQNVDLYEILSDELNGKFIYYKDAYEYLIQKRIDNFKDVFEEEIYDVASIATYYLYEELYDYLNNFADNLEKDISL